MKPEKKEKGDLPGPKGGFGRNKGPASLHRATPRVLRRESFNLPKGRWKKPKIS